MIRRTSLATPKRRRCSTPSRSSGKGTTAAVAAAAQSGISASSEHNNEPVNFLPLHQTADGRVERRVRRNGLRDMLNKIEQDKRRKTKTAQTAISSLKAELKARDREIYELQNATVIIDTERIWDLERQIHDLQGELEKRTTTTTTHSDRGKCSSWNLDSRDPFASDFMDMTPEEDHFGDVTMVHLHASTPSRARSSFPTPPATSPVIPTAPASPCFRHVPLTPSSHTGVQVQLPDPERQQLDEELASLQLEVCKLTTTLDSYKSLGYRLAERISAAAPISSDTSLPFVTEGLEAQVGALIQTMSDRTVALAALTASISDLGFPGHDAGEMIATLTSGFRAARLELEYLTPGEVTLPLTSHGAEVLDLLLTQLRALATKVKEDEDTIDEYHDIELSLRKQLDARVSVMDSMQAEMSKAEKLVEENNAKIHELEVGNDRLKGAVDGYVRDMAELERLVERMEQENRELEATRSAQQKSNADSIAAKDTSIAELETKIAEAVNRSADLQKEINDSQAHNTRQTNILNKRHGEALALRDSRVIQLRSEVGRVNDSLRAAHETIRTLRVENRGLKTEMDVEKEKAKSAVDSMKGELQRVLQMSQEFLNSSRESIGPGDGETKSSDGPNVIVKPGTYLNPDLARRGSGKMRRRHDSGLGFLDEDEEDFF